MAAEDISEVSSITSANGDANDLAHNGVYDVSFTFLPTNASYAGPTTITLDGIARTDRLWLFGIGASICGATLMLKMRIFSI